MSTNTYKAVTAVSVVLALVVFASIVAAFTLFSFGPMTAFLLGLVVAQSARSAYKIFTTSADDVVLQ